MRPLSLCVALVAAAVLLLPPTRPEQSRGDGPAASPEGGGRTDVSYDKDIEPILVHRCHLCHDAVAKKGNLDMSSYELLMKGGQGGKAVYPGRSAESLIVRMILHQQKPFMPPATEEPVAVEELLLLKRWIDEGAKGPARPKMQP